MNYETLDIILDSKKCYHEDVEYLLRGIIDKLEDSNIDYCKFICGFMKSNLRYALDMGNACASDMGSSKALNLLKEENSELFRNGDTAISSSDAKRILVVYNNINFKENIGSGILADILPVETMIDIISKFGAKDAETIADYIINETKHLDAAKSFYPKVMDRLLPLAISVLVEEEQLDFNKFIEEFMTSNVRRKLDSGDNLICSLGVTELADLITDEIDCTKFRGENTVTEDAIKLVVHVYNMLQYKTGMESSKIFKVIRPERIIEGMKR